MLVILCLVFILGGILVLVGVSLSKSLIFDREKNRPFECGFTPKSTPRLPLSLRFYLIALIFLIFDVELVLIFPVVLSTGGSQVGAQVGLLLVFVLILLGGLYHERNQGRLRWAS